jgi:hypothetical protein
VQGHQPRRLHLGRRVGDPVLHGLLVGQERAVRVARQRALAEHVERAPRDAEPAHAVVDAARPQALLGDQEAGAARTEQVVLRHADVAVEDLGVAADVPEALGGVLHRADVAHDVDARRFGRHDDHRRTLVLVGVRVGDRHDDQEVRHGRVGGEPFVAVDDPFVAVEHGGRLQRGGVRAGVAGLGHRERRAQVAGEQWIQPLLLLVLAAGQREDLGVARVRRVVAEHERRQEAHPEDLMHEPELHLAEALAAEVRRQVRGEQPARLDLLLERRDRTVEALLAELVEHDLEGIDLRPHELAHPIELLLELGLGREVPRHLVRSPQSGVITSVADTASRSARSGLTPVWRTDRQDG